MSAKPVRDEPRLDEHDVDPEAPDLEAQGVGDGLERVLRRVVGGGAREGEPAVHGADVDDPATAGPAHAREHELAQADEPDDVGPELGAQAVERHGPSAPLCE